MTRKYGREGGGIQQGNVASGICTKRHATGSRYFFPSSVPKQSELLTLAAF